MTDGLPELFNAQRESLGYDPITDVLTDHASAAPDAICDQLIHLAESWSIEESFNDDVTILVIKIL